MTGSCSGGRAARARGITVLAVPEVAGYVSDRLGFHHPESGPRAVRTETKRGWKDGKLQGKVPGEQRRLERFSC